MNSPQNVVITGASAGVGRAAARAFGGRGDNVALLARGQGGLDGAVKDVEAAGGHALAIPTDVADYQQVVPPPTWPRRRSARSTCGSTSPSRRCSHRSTKSPPTSTAASPR